MPRSTSPPLWLPCAYQRFSLLASTCFGDKGVPLLDQIHPKHDVVEGSIRASTNASLAAGATEEFQEMRIDMPQTMQGTLVLC